MEQVESIPFSELIAGMLLYKKSYTSLEIAIVLSKLEEYGIVVDDENDDLSIISCCVEMNSNYGFCLKKCLNYSTILFPGVEVSDFLKIHTNDKVLLIIGDSIENFISQETSMSRTITYNSSREISLFSILKNKVLSKRKKNYECYYSRNNIILR